MNMYNDTDPAAGEETAVQQWIQDGYSMLWMDEDDYRCDSEVEADSDHDDHDDSLEQHGGWLGNNLLHFDMDLDPSETGTVRRRTKTIVTPKMAMESFRLSFLNDDQDVNFDAILGELSELETQLNTTHSELTQTLGRGGAPHIPQCVSLDGKAEVGSDVIQAELDALAAEITQGLSYRKTNGQLLTPVHSEQAGDTGETDSAFSDNASLPSSESFTSMATVSSSAETTSSSSGETCSMNSAVSALTVHSEEEHLARVKAEKIRIALEKIKEAKIRKLFVRAFAKDGSSKSILVDEKMAVSQVCSLLADKHHGRLTHHMAVIEHMPDLFMERILEDHDSLVENMVMWTRDSKNKVLFEERQEKYNLFFHPEKYLLPGSSSQKGAELGSSQRERLIQEFFSPTGVSVPEVEGALFLKSDGKKAWKKYFFVLRASGLYYNPKGKVSKAPKDLVCLVQFEYVEVYWGLGWKKKYHAPTDFCFALKHPQIQKKTSKYIRYFCAETQTSLEQWIMGMRIAKLGKQLLHNFERVHHEVATWDLRQTTTNADCSDCGLGSAGLQRSGENYSALNQTSLQDSRLSVLAPSTQHTIVTVHSASLGRTNAALGGNSYHANEAVGLDGIPVPHRKELEGVGEVTAGHKTPTKRVSFSTTHCIITDSSEQLVVAKHRDSIVSASTDSSEDSSSSGENRHTMANTLRGKLRPKLPVTTETTRLLTEMNQLSFDSGTSPSGDVGSFDEVSSLSSGSSTLSRHTFSRSDRRRSSMSDRRGSTDSNSRTTQHHRMNGGSATTPMSPPPSLGRRHSHEGSPGRMSPLMRHSGTQQWVDEVQCGMDSMSAMPEGSRSAQDPFGGSEHYMYAGGMSVYQQQQYQYQQQQQQYQQQLQAYQEQYQLHKQYQQQQHPQTQQPQSQYQEMQRQDPRYLALQEHQEEQKQQHPSYQQEYDINPHLYATIGQAASLSAAPPGHGDLVPPSPLHLQEAGPPSPPLPPLPEHMKQALQQSKVLPPPTAPKPAGQPLVAQPVHPQQPPPPPPMVPQQIPPPPMLIQQAPPPPMAPQVPPPPVFPHIPQLPVPPPQAPLPPRLSQPGPPLPVLPQHASPAVLPKQAPPPHIVPQQAPPPHIVAQQGPPPHIVPQQAPPPHIVPQQASHPHIVPQQTPPPHIVPQQGPPPHIVPQQGPPHIVPQQAPHPHIVPQQAPPLPVLPQHVPPPLSHPQQAPPPPVLPKTVSTETTVYGTTGRQDVGRGQAFTVLSPVLDAARTLPLPGSKGGPPPLKIPSPQFGKVGPPVLPKSSAASPMSPISSHGQHRVQGGMPTSPMSPLCPLSAPSTLVKSGTASPTAYHQGQGHMMNSADNYYETVSHPGGSPNSPHRISHVKHPSTGSPMLGMGSSPPASQGPTPSDSGYIEGDSSCACSPSNLLYLGELSRRSQGAGSGTSPPKTCAQTVDAAVHGAANHRRSASAGSSIVKGGKQEAGKRAPPPPPPKRSETTRLSTDVLKQSKKEMPSVCPSAQVAEHEPPIAHSTVYQNYDGILDINDLPPPPPELLVGLADVPTESAAVPANTASHGTSKKQQKLPPPPPKRSKDTQLSHH